MFQESGARRDEGVGDDDQDEPEGIRPEVGPQVGQQRPQFTHMLSAMSPGPSDPGKSHSKEGMMTRTLLTALAVAGLAACGGGERRDVATADSLSRDLQLAPVDTTAELSDQPIRPGRSPGPRAGAEAHAQARSQAEAARAEAGRARSSSSSGPRARSLARGWHRNLGHDRRRDPTRRKNKVGDEVTATVASDIKDASGRVVVPAGSKVVLKVTAIKPSDSKSDTTGTLSLDAGVERRSERQGSADGRDDLRRADQAAGQGHRRQ